MLLIEYFVMSQVIPREVKGQVTKDQQSVERRLKYNQLYGGMLQCLWHQWQDNSQLYLDAILLSSLNNL